MYEFYIMHKDQVVTHVCMTYDKQDVIRIERFVKRIGIQPLYCESNNSVNYIYRFLKSRCFQDNYAGLAEVLHYYNMETNDPYVFIQKTHGVMRKDFLWIRFPGENLSWEDVRPK